MATADGDNNGPPEKKRGIGGAPESSFVWDYFNYNKSTNKSICQVKLADQRICGQSYTGKDISSLKNHLKSIHHMKVDELIKKQQEEKEKRKLASSSVQVLLSESFKFATSKSTEKYPSDHFKQQKIDKLLAKLIGSTNIPKSFVEREEFRELMYEVDPKYRMPTRQNISEKIEKIEDGMKMKMATNLENIDCLSAICVDLWSRRGLSASYLGITGHFFNEKTNRPTRILLGLEKLDYPHTAERILASTNVVLTKWNIDLDPKKVFRVLTDNGSNIVKAFRDFIHHMEFDLSNEEMEESDYEENDLNLQIEENDAFENREYELNNSFVERNKRLSCVDHQLARVLYCGVEGDNADESAKEIIEIAHALLFKLKKRAKATEYFINKYSKKLLQPAKTRWAYHYYVLNRLFELKEGIREVIDNEIIDEVQNLTPYQWRQVKALHDILEPFSKAITELEGENYVTLSQVIPYLINIKLGLAIQAQSSLLSNLAKLLFKLMEERFGFIFNSRDKNFEPIFAIATFLDLQYSRSFDLRDMADPKLKHRMAVLKQKADNEIIYYLRDQLGNDILRPNDSPIHNDNVDDGMAKFPNLLANISQSSNETNTENSNYATAKLEVDSYLKFANQHRNQYAFDFWSGQRLQLPNLYRFATTVLSIPATTAPVERLFSHAGYCLNNNRHRLNDKNLEKELMIRINKNFLDM